MPTTLQPAVADAIVIAPVPEPPAVVTVSAVPAAPVFAAVVLEIVSAACATVVKVKTTAALSRNA
jgi:hypothetical protein